MILTGDDRKRMDALAEDVQRLELTEDDKRGFEALERELSEIDLDFLLR